MRNYAVFLWGCNMDVGVAKSTWCIVFNSFLCDLQLHIKCTRMVLAIESVKGFITFGRLWLNFSLSFGYFHAGDATSYSCRFGIMHPILWSNVCYKRIICYTSTFESWPFSFLFEKNIGEWPITEIIRACWFCNSILLDFQLLVTIFKLGLIFLNNELVIMVRFFLCRLI